MVVVKELLAALNSSIVFLLILVSLAWLQISTKLSQALWDPQHDTISLLQQVVDSSNVVLCVLYIHTAR